jgi:hypothetical protein
MTNRILIFSPYAGRPHLTFYEGTIAKSCQIRGATVEYLLCDGLLPECDNHWDSFLYSRPRPFELCQRCQSKAKAFLDEFGLPYKWLGEFVSEDEKETAFTWSQNLSPSDMLQACFMGYPVGEWVISSIASYFRRYPPDMRNWRVVAAYRGFLYSAAIVAVGLKNYLKINHVDSALLFNGRQSLTRVAFELLRQHGIRELTHEFPFYQRGHLLLKTNARCWSIEPFNEFWKMWGKVPLSRSSLEKTLKWLQNRRYGNGLSWFAFNNPHFGELSVRKTLDLNPDKQLFALFTSSTDETAGDPELQGPYESQSVWVKDVVEWVRGRNDVELVIRVHPHLAGNTGLGRAFDEYNFYLELKSVLPANVRVIMPDESLNSYALMDQADICLSFGSSVGLEMAMLGKPVILGSRAFYEDGAYVLNIRSKQSLPEILGKSLRPQASREIRREAFRQAYYYVFMFELPFPLVSMPEVLDVTLNYTSTEELAPGRDDTLDHICSYLIHGQPLYDSPTEIELARTTEVEDAFFAELERKKEPMRDVAYEKSFLRQYQLNKIGRSIQKAVKRLPLGGGYVLNKVGKAIFSPLTRWISGKS